MNIPSETSNLDNSQPHVQRTREGYFEFNAEAVEISIIDRRGNVVWRTLRIPSTGTPLWDGCDMAGKRLVVGSYTCKLRYANHQIVYVPFVFIR